MLCNSCAIIFVLSFIVSFITSFIAVVISLRAGLCAPASHAVRQRSIATTHNTLSSHSAVTPSASRTA